MQPVGTGVRTLEKNVSWGRRLGRPLGAGLLAASLGLVLYYLAA